MGQIFLIVVPTSVVAATVGLERLGIEPDLALVLQRVTLPQVQERTAAPVGWVRYREGTGLP